MKRRAILLGAFLLLAASGWAGAQAHFWLMALALPVLAAGLLWDERWAGFLAGTAAAWGVWLMAQGQPSGRILPAVLALGLLAMLVWRKEREMEEALGGLEREELSLRGSFQALEGELEQGRSSIQVKEEAVQEIGELYQLSKQFLATLSWEEGRRIVEQALARWLPSLTPSEKQKFLDRVKELIEKGEVSVENIIHAMPLAGTDFPARERWAIVGGQLALGLQRVCLYRQVQESATHDGLTGLLVRRHFGERLEEEVERSTRRGSSLAFLMVDLDLFKQVNDRYGHLVGDVVLREVAGLIRGLVRDMDLVGRYGGEEFGVVLPDAGEALGFQIAERIRTGVGAASIRAYDEQIRITVSIGVALHPAHASSAEQLIEQADQAMYRAKAMGRNRTLLAAPSSRGIS